LWRKTPLQKTHAIVALQTAPNDRSKEDFRRRPGKDSGVGGPPYPDHVLACALKTSADLIVTGDSDLLMLNA
jgi:hypothetical protein